MSVNTQQQGKTFMKHTREEILEAIAHWKRVLREQDENTADEPAAPRYFPAGIDYAEFKDELEKEDGAPFRLDDDTTYG